MSTAGSCYVACTDWSQVVTRFIRSFSSRDFSLAHGCCQLAATESRASDTFIVHVVLREINGGVSFEAQNKNDGKVSVAVHCRGHVFEPVESQNIFFKINLKLFKLQSRLRWFHHHLLYIAVQS